ncbi:MAG: hypothetical protein PHQ98_01495 [Candidatus ainarchaeum sp.]|nr:hypothetical protein [Candidatus ainarchaeum sp.]
MLLQNIKRQLRRIAILSTSLPLLRDRDFLSHRIIYKKKIRGRTLIWKSSGGKREANARKTASEVVPKEGKHYSFQLSKRYPRIANQKRWEKYYDLPSLKDIFDGNKNRRLKKLLINKNLNFKKFYDACIEGYEELQKLAFENIIREGYKYDLDLGPDQFMVDFINEKPHFILIDI